MPAGICRATQQFGLNLMGRSEDPFLLAGESGYDEREVLPAARREGDEVALSTVATQKLGLHFWSGDDAGAMAVVADEAIEHIGGMAGTAFTPLIYLVERLEQDPAPRRRSARPEGRCGERSPCTASGRPDAPANYAAPYALIQGTWARARGAAR